MKSALVLFILERPNIPVVILLRALRGHTHLLTPRQVERQVYSLTRDPLRSLTTHSNNPLQPLSYIGEWRVGHGNRKFLEVDPSDP